MRYQHPKIGFAFDVPPEWTLDNVRQSRDGLVVVHRKGAAGLFLRVTDSQDDAAARLQYMEAHLVSVGAAGVDACAAPPFARTDDVVAVCFDIEGNAQRWISARRDGYDYSLSHTGPWQEVEQAVSRVAASFVFPPPAVIRNALPPAGMPGEAPASASSSAMPRELPGLDAPARASQAPHANIEARFHISPSWRLSVWQRLRAWLDGHN